MGQGILLFDTNASGSANQAQTYLQDAFNDIALPATNNSGFTSTVSTNPLNQNFANDNAPRYAAKTLWIKDLVLLSDRTQWINDKPTYQVIFNEDFPQAKAYVFGTISLTSTTQGNRVDIQRMGDGIGVGGVISRVQWLVETKLAQPSTAQLFLDNVAGSTIDFSGTIEWTGQPKYNAYVNAATNSTYNLHDYRLTALQAGNLSVTGLVVYYEITGLGINVFGGDSYINKTQALSLGTTLAVPQVNTLRGGRSVIYKTAQSTYGITTTTVADVVSIATGATNTNLLSLTPGTGQSFPVGTAVYFAQGTSVYIGNVLSQSTDTLTMGVTLPFGVSASVYQLFQAGHTAFPISSASYEQAFQFDASAALNTSQNSTLPVTNFSFSDPNLTYRLWGGTIGVGPGSYWWGASYAIGLGASTLLDLQSSASFLQIDGNFQALEFEFAAGISAKLSATLSIDGLGMYSFNDNVSSGLSGPGFFRKYIMTNAGPGFHSVNLARATGHTQVALTKVTGYASKVTNGPSFGILASLDFGQTFIPRNSIGASFSSFGNVKRIFANSLPYKGSWGIGVSAGFAGNVTYFGSSNGTSACILNFQYYGSAFAFIGSIGTSSSVTIDGAGTSALANTWLGLGLSNTFHSVVFTAGATSQIDAIDFVRPQGQLKWLNNFSVPANPSFFEMLNGQLSLKASSITSREIGAKVVGRSNLLDVGQQISASSSSFSTASITLVDVTNLTVTITTTGRPVVLSLQADTTGNEAYLGVNTPSSGTFYGTYTINRASSTIASVDFGGTVGAATLSRTPVGQVFIDPVTAGTYTYKVQLKQSGSATDVRIFQASLVAYEL